MKTNIRTKRDHNTLVPVFNAHSSIKRWTIDREDIDNVLRIEAKESLQEKELLSMIQAHGFSCEELQ